MLSNISWHGYWTALAILSLLYYTTILFFYYRQDLKRWLQQKRHPAAVAAATIDDITVRSDVHLVQSTLFQDDGAVDSKMPPPDSAEYSAYACMDELTAFFEQAKARRWYKQQLVQSLKQILTKYPFLKDSEYKSSLGQVIQAQSEQYCSIHLKADDVVGLWL